MTATQPFAQAEVAPQLDLADAAVAAGGMIPQFEQWCKAQPTGSEWCWAAVGGAMLAFAKAERLLPDQVAGRIRHPPPSLQTSMNMETVLSRLGLDYDGPINFNENGESLLAEHLVSQRPVAIVIFWRVRGSAVEDGSSHVIAAYGWNPASRYVDVFDPNTVGDTSDIKKSMPVESLTNYLEGSGTGKFGRWGNANFAVSRGAG